MKRSSHASFIEPLESRIAPARILITGVPDGLNDPNNPDINYDNAAFFVDTEQGVAQGDQISTAVGPGAPLTADTFYLKLSAGDTLKVYNSTNGPEEYLTVKTGNVVAFFIDGNLNNEVDSGELVSLSLGKDAAFVLKNGLSGSIVTNLNEQGTRSLADDTIDLSSLVSAKQGIRDASIGVGVQGKILAGGNIGKISINESVDSILAGSATDGATYDLFPGVAGGEGTISFTAAPRQIGASISNVVVSSLSAVDPAQKSRIEAGAGGAGAKGGSLTFIQVTGDFDGFSLLAGKGGDADATNRSGGLGGSISRVYISGVADSSANDLVEIHAGAGGSFATAGSGGKGGSVTSVFVGSQLIGNTVVQSKSPLADNISIEAGAGGSGKFGGIGGSLSALDVLVVTPADGNAGGAEISLIAGVGGDNIVAAAGKTGAGGSITSAKIRNAVLTADATIAVQAGDGGLSAGAGTGAAGGSIKNLSVLGTDLSIIAGHGSSGKTGGAGGSLTAIVIEQAEGVVARNAIVSAGFGGDGQAGNAGNGGNVTSLRIDDGDFATLQINAGIAANGGASVGGRGGKGGTVSGADIIEGDTGIGLAGTFLLRAGNGGDGSRGGGLGGSLLTTNFTGLNMSADVTSGIGGSVVGAGARGNGGNAGQIKSLSVDAGGQIAGVDVSASILAGIGGDGFGASGSGGIGGSVSFASVTVAGNGQLHAGDGGSGDGRAAGRGGSVTLAGVFAGSGSGELFAGNGGAGGMRGGAGGSILGTSSTSLSGLYAATDLTIQAGSGTHGGAGGSLRYVGFGSTSSDLTPTPNGNILIAAGDGSAEGRVAGVGGFIDNVSGPVSDGNGTTTFIHAGKGGASDFKGANGGSISNLIISRGGTNGTLLTIEAGDAGDGGPNARTGGKGGDVRGVSVDDIGTTNFRSVAAGKGGDGTVRGGIGGTIDNVRVSQHDIGVRTGEVYGYTTMGGIFAGAGGNATVAGDAGKGKAGSVSNISAKAIAAIVAGRGPAPELVEKVAAITLVDDGFQLLHESTGAFIDSVSYMFDPVVYANANLVGAIADISRVNAYEFQFNDTNANGLYDLGEVPIDGLIAAKTFVQSAPTNFTPEAKLTIEGKPGTLKFYDFDNKI